MTTGDPVRDLAWGEVPEWSIVRTLNDHERRDPAPVPRLTAREQLARELRDRAHEEQALAVHRRYLRRRVRRDWVDRHYVAIILIVSTILIALALGGLQWLVGLVF